MPVKKDAQWWKDYRAQKKAPTPEPVEEIKAPRGIPEMPVGSLTPRPKNQTKFRALPGDDWVQKLTQHQRDQILDRINSRQK